MKKYKKLFVILIISMSFLFLLPNVKGFDDIEYDFERDILFNETEPELELFNVREQQVYNGTYSGLYSFTDDTVGSEPEGWISSHPVGSEIEVLESIGNHKKVVRLRDTNPTIGTICSNNFVPQTEGVIEFWYQSTATSKRSTIVFKNELNQNTVYFSIDGGQLSVVNGGSTVIATITTSSWNHFSVDFDSSTDTYDVDFNGILVKSNQPFANVATSLNNISFQIGVDKPNDGSYTNYFDGVGYSWDLVQNSGTTENFNDDNIGDNPSGWNTIEGINCFANITSTLDSRVKPLGMFDGDVNDEFCQVSNDFSSSEIQNLQFDMTFNTLGSTNTTIYLMEGSTIIIIIEFTNNDVISSNGLGGGDTIKNNFLTANIFSVFRFVFDHDNDIFDVFIDGVLEVNDLAYLNNVASEIDEIIIRTGIEPAGSFNYIFYIDNIVFNSENYESGVNIVPS